MLHAAFTVPESLPPEMALVHTLHQQGQYIVTRAAVWLSDVCLTTLRGKQHSQVSSLMCMSVCRGSWQRLRRIGASLKPKLQKRTATPGTLFWNTQYLAEHH